MQMNSPESGLQKGRIALLSFPLSFPFALDILPSLYLSSPPTDPHGPWARSGGEKVWISSRRQCRGERFSGLGGWGGGGCRAPARPALGRGFAERPARYPLRTWGPARLGVGAGSGARGRGRKAAEGAGSAPSGGGVLSAGQGGCCGC